MQTIHTNEDHERETVLAVVWSEELGRLKKEVATLKRRIRCAAPIRRSKVVEAYLSKKAEYENELASAQTKSWKDFCEKQDKEGLSEGIYRVIGRTKSREEDLPLRVNGATLGADESVKLLTDIFYPADSPDTDTPTHIEIRRRAEHTEN